MHNLTSLPPRHSGSRILNKLKSRSGGGNNSYSPSAAARHPSSDPNQPGMWQYSTQTAEGQGGKERRVGQVTLMPPGQKSMEATIDFF